MRNNGAIRSPFCTSHDSWPVVAFTKWWYDWIITIKILVKKKKYKISMMRSYTLCEMGSWTLYARDHNNIDNQSRICLKLKSYKILFAYYICFDQLIILKLYTQCTSITALLGAAFMKDFRAKEDKDKKYMQFCEISISCCNGQTTSYYYNPDLYHHIYYSVTRPQ